jgi:arginyl-tRNA synthetase
MVDINQKLQLEIEQVLKTLGFQKPQSGIVIDFPTKDGFGDLTTNIAFHLTKLNKRSPFDIANDIKKSLEENKNIEFVQKIEVVKPGFINFTLTNQALWQNFVTAVGLATETQRDLQGKNIMVEYSSPNIAKPFNVGHLRSTIIGDSIARLYKHLGAEVITDNHLGDWGTQYGKLAFAVEQWGDWTAINANPIPELFKLYVRINEESEDDPLLQEQARDYFKRLESGDPHVRQIWQTLSELSLKDFNKLYEQFGVHFDVMLGESFYEPYLKDVIQECVSAGIVEESEGALIIMLDEPRLQKPPVMIKKSNGSSTYATRDLAAVKYRFNHFKLDKLVIEIGNEQSFYFDQIIAVAEKMGWVGPGQLIHVGHGLFLGSSGKKLSTRKGETVWLKELVGELKETAQEIVAQKSPGLSEELRADIAQKVAIGALKYNDLSQNRNSNITFDKEKSLSLEGNSAPYLQYTIARAKSVLRLAENVPTDHRQSIRAESLTPSERLVLTEASKWQKTVDDMLSSYLPSALATYLFDLAQAFNYFYHTDPILQANPDDKMRRLSITQNVTDILTSGLHILGIESPERM